MRSREHEHAACAVLTSAELEHNLRITLGMVRWVENRSDIAVRDRMLALTAVIDHANDVLRSLAEAGLNRC